MKKLFALLLVSVLALTAVTGCGKSETKDEAESLKLGLGVAVTASATDATEDKAGQGQATTTVAAVLVDAEGKIVKAFIDCADNKVGYTFDGKAVANDSFKTKYETGKDYNMVAYGGAKLEWYEQADAFCALIAGKTADEVKALVAADAKGTEEVINAGCTIYVSDFAKAVEKAVANATDSKATKNDTIKIGAYTAQTTADATEDKAGSNKVETTFLAAALSADGTVTAASSDCVEVTFGFDLEGKSAFDASAEILSKKEKGDAYGMVAYGGAKNEWYQQAAAFDSVAVGKTPAEIAGLIGEDGRGTEDVQTAGCTIYVSGFTAAAAKLG